MKDDIWGGQVNVDRRFDPRLIVESTVIFRNSCRFVLKHFVETVDCRFQDLFVVVDFVQNFVVDCRQNAKKL